MLESIIKGFGLGMILAISVGPVIFTILKQSLNNGQKGGFSFVAGVWFSDILLVFISNMFSTLVMSALAFKSTIGFLGAAFVISLGIYSLFFKKVYFGDDKNVVLIEFGKKAITKRRVLAAFVTVFAVLVSVFDRIDAQNLSLFAVFFGVFAGAIVGVQRALNGQINESTQQSFTTSLLNFIMGTTFLLIFLILAALITQVEIVALPSGPWWMYTGGTIGVIYIAFTSTIVQHLGVLTFTLISVGGQLVGSLLIDLYSPTQGVQISAYLVTGILMTYLGVVVGGVGNSQKRRLLKRQ